MHTAGAAAPLLNKSHAALLGNHCSCTAIIVASAALHCPGHGPAHSPADRSARRALPLLVMQALFRRKCNSRICSRARAWGHGSHYQVVWVLRRRQGVQSASALARWPGPCCEAGGTHWAQQPAVIGALADNTVGSGCCCRMLPARAWAAARATKLAAPCCPSARHEQRTPEGIDILWVMPGSPGVHCREDEASRPVVLRQLAVPAAAPAATISSKLALRQGQWVTGWLRRRRLAAPTGGWPTLTVVFCPRLLHGGQRASRASSLPLP